MRIVQLSSMMSFYGGEVHLASLASGMQTRGHDVTCVVRPGSEMERVLPDLGLNVCVLPLLDWFDLSSVAQLSRLLRGLKCDILHSHLPRDYFLSAVSTLGSPVVNVGTRHQLHPLSHAFLKRPFLNRFSEFIAVSEAVGAGLLEGAMADASHLSVVHHGLEKTQNALMGMGTLRRLRMKLGVLPDVPLVGFVGRLCPTKGVDTLIKAAGILKKRWPLLKIVLVGDETKGTGYRTHLEKLIRSLAVEDIVIFAGYLPEARKISQVFDIQVVPSVAEPFGLVTLEAMAAGVPVVVTNSGGSPEIVRDGVEGFLFGPGNEEALARKLESLLDSPGLRQEMGQRGLQRIAESFSMPRMLDCTEGVYRRALKIEEPAEGRQSA